jgi:hypothetical protein
MSYSLAAEVKVKLSLCLLNEVLSHEDVWGSGGIAPPFLISALDGGEWSAWRPGCFNRGEIGDDAHWIRGWVSLRAHLDVVEKNLAHFGIRAPVVETVACRYTDWAILAYV